MEEVIRVFVGTEPAQRIPCEVSKSSILRRTSCPIEFIESWTIDRGWHPLMPRLKHGTRFSGWRWVVADACGRAGKAIYLDADQIVLADINELWNSLPPGKAFSAVINAVGIFGKKSPEPDHVQTSVMVLDCGHPFWNAAQLCLNGVATGKVSYRDLMQAAFVDRQLIHELAPEWNHFGIVTTNTKLCHFSHVASQPWMNKAHPIAHVWQTELLASIRAGHVARALLKSQCDAGHLDRIYWKRLKEVPV